MGPKRDYFLDVTMVTALCLLWVTHGQKPEVRAKVGGVVEMACRLPLPYAGASVPLHVVEWVRQGFDIPVLMKFGVYAPRVHPNYEGRVSLVRNTVLRVKGLLIEDQGLYECRILLLDKTTDETRNGTWTLLSVTAPPIFSKTPPPVMEALVGNPLSLACVAHGNPPPTITWAKDGTLIEGDKVEVLSGTLSLRAVDREAGGQYECLASNAEGNVTHVTKLKVKGPPVIVIPPKDTSLNMTQDAQLQCQALADPPNMTYVWQREGENVYHIEALKSRVKIMVDGTLLITRITPDDSGNYTCMPTNGLLTPPTASANLTVTHPAQALLMPPQTYLPTGLGGLVSCPVRAQPPLLRVDWTKDGQPLDLAMYPGWTLTSEGSVFMATANDDATGKYTCTPYNSYGTMGQSGPTTVILQDPPSLSVCPRKEYRQEVGRILVIPCQTTGDPAPSITWSKVGPATRSQYSVASNGSLLLLPLSKDHQGEWVCSVTNRVATVKASTLISVLGTSPHAATLVSVTPGAKQANVSWEPGFDGGYTQKFTVWLKQMSVGDSGEKQEWLSVPVPSSSGSSLQVTGLVPATEYQFSVLPHNKVGTGPFSEIATVRTLNPLPRRAKLEPPTSLSANQSLAGIVLQWSPYSQFLPITGFVLQSRTEQGEWFNLDEDIGANRSVMIVPGLRKDCVYELRLLSRRGELLSEPSPSVNVSTMGMDMYPATSRFLEFVPEPLLAGVMGGVGFLCLALILVLGTVCIFSHKRDQRCRKMTDDLPPAIYKSPPSTRSLASSPDSVLKQKLLPPHCHPHYPGSHSSCSSSQSDHSSFGRDSHSEYKDQRQQLLSCPPPPPHYAAHHHHHLPRIGSSPNSPLEFISRGPDGRFIVQPYDQASAPSSNTMRSLRKDFPQSTGVQRSVSLRSEKRVGREPPFVLSVDLPPCSGTDPNPTTRVRAMAKHLSLHGRFYLDEEQDSCAGHPDKSSLYSDSNSDMSPQPSLEESNPGYPSLKRAVQPATASTLVLQMEHEKETGNLSRCLKLAREREELERELRKYTLDSNATLDGKREGPGSDEVRWREFEECDPIWKPQDNTSPHSHPHHLSHPQVNRGCSSMAKGPSPPSYIHWEASPLISATSLVPAHQTPSERTAVLHCDLPLTHCPSLSPVTQHPFRSERPECHSKRRVSQQPLGRQEGMETARVKTHTGLCDETHISTELKRGDLESHEWNGKSNQCNVSISHKSKPDVSVNKVPGSWRVELARSQPCEESSLHTSVDLSECVEMSVDEPEDEGSVDPPTNPISHQRHAHQVNNESPLAEKDHRGLQTMKGHRAHPLAHRKSPVPREEREKWHRRSSRSRSPATIQPPRPALRKAISLGGFQNRNGGNHQRSQSLDSRRQSLGNFLTPDAWVDSLSQENCSSPFSFRPDSVFFEPENSLAPETPTHTEAPLASLPPPPPPPTHQDTRPPSRAPQQLCEAYGGDMHIQSVRRPVLERQTQLPPTPPSVPSSPSHPTHDPRKKASIFPDAYRWPITYQEALRSVQRMEARKNASLPRDHREHPRPPDCRGRTTAPSLLRGYSWPAPHHIPQPPQEEEKKLEEVVVEEEKEERYGGHEVEIGRYHRGVPDLGGSYSSYASQSSGRGSLEPPNGRMSICLSPTLTSSPESTEEMQGNTVESHLQDMETLKRRKASVDENYEWDSADVSIQLGDQDLEGRGLFSSVSLLKSTPSMHHSREGLKESVHFQGHRHVTSRHSEPEPETVMF
ncbi:protein turtle homolog A isoform X1 [Oncorhynchus kisutch]|uniref:Immunoglobulin superfamily, member 9a n=1 Tax=Oncorhynchus kisutch TaxID=8019 RepID=A0A8C7DKG8_ONCKI|nr:protein turtle homolog A isoform X1 [Oncorhynchus kisutch]